jgi:hypothetical protein
MSQLLKVLSLLSVGFVLMSPGAQAAILCEGNFQIVHGTAISSAVRSVDGAARTCRERFERKTAHPDDSRNRRVPDRQTHS